MSHLNQIKEFYDNNESLQSTKHSSKIYEYKLSHGISNDTWKKM